MKKLIVSISLLFVFAVSGSRAESAERTRLRVGYPSPSASFFPLFATKEVGLFEKYGFDVEMIYVQGVQLVQVHVAGQLDVASISSVVYLQAAVEGADLIQIASSVDGQLMKVMVHPSITKPQDLKGKTLAVTRFGSLTDLLVRPALRNWGLEPMKDVKLVQIGRMPDIATAISQRTVDGGVISFPTSVQAEKLNIKTLLDFAESDYALPATTVVISPGTVRAIVTTSCAFSRPTSKARKNCSPTASWASGRCENTAASATGTCWPAPMISLLYAISRRFPR